MTSGEDTSVSQDAMSVESWTLLLACASDVEEMVLEAASQIDEGRQATQTSLAEILPRRFIPRYDAAFAQRMAGTASGLARKLEKARERGSGLGRGFLNSVAEEMLMSEAIRMAVDMAGSERQEDELEALQEHCFEDRDFEWLYDLSRDGGIEDPEVQAKAGFANLGFDDWFDPFR